MLKDDMWKIFEATGKIDAYLYCKIDEENNKKEKETNLKSNTEENILS